MTTELPSDYAKYDSDTQDQLASLLESIDHLIHVLNGVRADIMNGNYSREQAELDAENITYSEGIDVFSALDDVALAEWSESEQEVV